MRIDRTMAKTPVDIQKIARTNSRPAMAARGRVMIRMPSATSASPRRSRTHQVPE
jgi:hypothetical protein